MTLYGYTPTFLIFDDPFKTSKIEEPVSSGPTKIYWTQPIPPKTKAVSSPSDAKRKALRAKRKKRN